MRTITAMLAFLLAGPVDAAVAKPNILFVLADDLDAASVRHLPEVRALAAAGTTFAAAYATTPVCAPSRVTLLTGRYPQNTGIRRNRPPAGGLEGVLARGLERRMVPGWLRAAGYRTGLIGKYLNEHHGGGPALHVPPGWDRWVGGAEWRFTHDYYGFALNEDGRRVFYPNRPGNYLFDVYARKARAFVADALDRGQPFALFLWPPVPHEPLVAAPRHHGLYPRVRVPRGAALPEADTSDKPPFLRFPPPGAVALAAADARHRDRLRMTRSLDEMLGSLRWLLAARGALADTYIVFTSDNGWHHAYHNLVPWKGTAYEADIRVPLIVSGPGVPAGRIVRRLVANADLAPTFAAWAGVPAPEVDGRSFARLLAAPDPSLVPWRKRLPIARLPEGIPGPAARWPGFARRPGGNVAYGCLAHVPAWRPAGIDPVLTPEFRGLRDERFTFVEYASGDLEIYDNLRDPQQVRNAACSLPPASLASLRRASAALARCRGAACRAIENR